MNCSTSNLEQQLLDLLYFSHPHDPKNPNDPFSMIAILDFGGQYSHLICNRIRRLGVHAVIRSHDTKANELRDMKGLILSGGPTSVNAPDALLADPEIFELGIPVLGICYGHQLTNKMLGGKVSPGKTKEYGKTKLIIDRTEGIFQDLPLTPSLAGGGTKKTVLQVWMSHWDEVTEIPVDFEVLAHTDINDFAAVGNLKKNIYGIQFHPEVTHTEQGMKILENFVNLTGAEKTWSTKNYLEQISGDAIDRVQKGQKIFMLVSGGVDSMVAFTLLNKVLGQDKVYGLFVDTGFMRKGEVAEVSKALDKLDFHNLHVVNASTTFYKALENVCDPEEKRRIIGKTFVEIQAKAVKELMPDSPWLLGQGTIYPDTIESGGTKNADKIKTHHNRVPEIQAMIDQGLVIEPLKELYKDEVRELGEMLGLPHELVWRHPFPGPGLAIRILCTSPSSANLPPCQGGTEGGLGEEVLEISTFLKPHGLTGQILPIRSVGVQGDVRTYRHPLAITPMNGKSWRDFWDFDNLQKRSTELTNKFSSINRVILSLSAFLPESYKLKAKSYLSPDRISLLQDADRIVMNEIESIKEIWQCPTILLPDNSIVIRPVSSIDAMTASFVLIPENKLEHILERLGGLKPSAIFYDLTNKPPATIEWE